METVPIKFVIEVFNTACFPVTTVAHYNLSSSWGKIASDLCENTKHYTLNVDCEENSVKCYFFVYGRFAAFQRDPIESITFKQFLVTDKRYHKINSVFINCGEEYLFWKPEDDDDDVDEDKVGTRNSYEIPETQIEQLVKLVQTSFGSQGEDKMIIQEDPMNAPLDTFLNVVNKFYTVFTGKVFFTDYRLKYTGQESEEFLADQVKNANKIYDLEIFGQWKKKSYKALQEVIKRPELTNLEAWNGVHLKVTLEFFKSIVNDWMNNKRKADLKVKAFLNKMPAMEKKGKKNGKKGDKHFRFGQYNEGIYRNFC
ncbi:hypothetical protein L596_013068 [Steinernema carpocapsae]|uniref:Uncharacterized protein n=1 Tax=Steinernema carpocapsae TaxID=34508 RepID=A0A4U5NZ46_STECR|nr:hypothetical protein L596_013068 [Steinernema carpocapsae]